MVAAAEVGLRILVQQLSLQNKWSKSTSNVVLKSCNLLKLNGSGKPSFLIDGNEKKGDYSSRYYSIKCCCLCKKKLRADEDVYMYKGDQGFCSVECRNRQIYLDDIAALEASTNKILSSSPYCSSSTHFDNHKNGVFHQDFGLSYSKSRRNQRRLVV